MSEDLRILFVDDDQADVLLARHTLERDGLTFECHTVASEVELSHALAQFRPDVVLCDYSLPGFSCATAMDAVMRLQPATPVLVISGAVAEETAIECLSQGATDYLLKSNLRRLGPAVRRAVADHRQRMALELRIEQLAHFDTLTGLPNLAHMNQLVSRAIERAREGQRLIALVTVNLDRFRFIDEACGRSAADDALCEISAVLKGQSRERDAVARIGADEFVLVLTDLGDSLQAAVLVQGLLAAIAAPRQVGGRELRITASAGIALFPDDGADFEALLGKSTEAMHEAKTATQGGLQFYSSDVVRHAQERRQLEAGLRSAIQDNELSLHFQPQFDIRNGRACGVEALARWFRRDGNSVSPSVFIPLAEQTGLIGALGGWALRTACGTAAQWSTAGCPPPMLSVNVSCDQIREEFTAEIADALANSGLPAERLELEITESVLLGNADRALECLAQWKRLGVRIAVDDFGTGYSSLSYLSRLPVDRLKLDKSLIRGMTTEARDATIVRAVISLGRELGFTVLAEGVETDEQLDMLEKLGCEQAQGYLLTPPTSAREALSLMGMRWGARGARHVRRRHPAQRAATRRKQGFEPRDRVHDRH